jgi:hypothetical protein
VFSNTFENPIFVGAGDFHLQTSSPCIDAGAPDAVCADMCITNGASQGTCLPDLGAYGGPDAANWLDNVPVLPTQAHTVKPYSFWLHWDAIPRSSYQVLVSDDVIHWTDLEGGPVTASSNDASTLLPASVLGASQRFFRVQSLGRLPGD